jgi:hypothetical protein
MEMEMRVGRMNKRQMDMNEREMKDSKEGMKGRDDKTQ